MKNAVTEIITAYEKLKPAGAGVIAIDGRAAAGKTTLAAALAAETGGAVVVVIFMVTGLWEAVVVASVSFFSVVVVAVAVAASSKVLPEISLVQLPADIIKAITAASIRLL